MQCPASLELRPASLELRPEGVQCPVSLEVRPGRGLHILHPLALALLHPSAHNKVVDYACCILWHSHFSTLCVVAFSSGLVYTFCIVTLSERTCTSSVQRECRVQWQ